MLLLVGFARPQAKFSEAKDGATVVLMVDISGSMGANDVKPTRLLAADAAITNFVNKLPSRYRVALITFSNGIAVKVPPTYDRKTLIKGLPAKAELEGTALGDALFQAVRVAKKAVGPSKPGQPHPPATILLVSDGGTNCGPRQAGPGGRAREEGGDPDLDRRRSAPPAGVVHQKVPIGTGKKTFPLVQQVPVDPKMLRAGRGGERRPLLRGHDSPSGSTASTRISGSRLVYTKQYREITAGVTLAAFVLIIAGAALSAWWFRRLV